MGLTSRGASAGEESILYAPALNQHSTTRSVHLETALRRCTAATPAPYKKDIKQEQRQRLSLAATLQLQRVRTFY